jgi:hypothetical protein
MPAEASVSERMCVQGSIRSASICGHSTESKPIEVGRDLAWGLGSKADAEEAHTGFEPVLPPTPAAKPTGSKPGDVTPPGDIDTRHQLALEPQNNPEEGAGLAPREFAPGVPEPVKSKLLQLMGKPAMTLDEIKHDEYLEKRRDQYRRRVERKAQEALDHDAN